MHQILEERLRYYKYDIFRTRAGYETKSHTDISIVWLHTHRGVRCEMPGHLEPLLVLYYCQTGRRELKTKRERLFQIIAVMKGYEYREVMHEVEDSLGVLVVGAGDTQGEGVIDETVGDSTAVDKEGKL